MAKNTHKNTDNLRPPWKKGESGNPNGRPKGQRNFKTIYREALAKLAETEDMTPDELEDVIVNSGLIKAMDGDYNFFRDFMDRLHGKPIQKNENENTQKVMIVPNEVADKLKDYEED